MLSHDMAACRTLLIPHKFTTFKNHNLCTFCIYSQALHAMVTNTHTCVRKNLTHRLFHIAKIVSHTYAREIASSTQHPPPRTFTLIYKWTNIIIANFYPLLKTLRTRNFSQNFFFYLFKCNTRARIVLILYEKVLSNPIKKKKLAQTLSKFI